MSEDSVFEGDLHTLNLFLEVYLKGRADSLHWPMRIDVSEDVTEVDMIMKHAYGRVNGILDSRSEDHILLIDDHSNYHMIFRADIQAISIGAPDKESLTWSLP